MAFTPAFAATSIPSRNGKNASLAIIESLIFSSGLEPNEPGILLLDEIQRFRSVDEENKEIHDYKFQDVWSLLSDGKFGADGGRKRILQELMLDILWEEDSFDLLYSDDTLFEYIETLIDHRISEPIIEEFLNIIEVLGIRIDIKFIYLPVFSRDPDDIPFLLCAHNGNATHLITYDDDLLGNKLSPSTSISRPSPKPGPQPFSSSSRPSDLPSNTIRPALQHPQDTTSTPPSKQQPTGHQRRTSALQTCAPYSPTP